MPVLSGSNSSSQLVSVLSAAKTAGAGDLSAGAGDRDKVPAALAPPEFMNHAVRIRIGIARSFIVSSSV